MGTVFKLIDDIEKNDIQKNKRMSLSRPLLSFGEPEGLVVDFFRDINRLVEDTQDIFSVKPTDELLCKIREWYMMYYGSLPDNHQASYTAFDVKSDLQILMCIYFQTYCGYFTNADLFCDKSRKHYFESNSDFIKKYNKTAILKIEIEENEFDCIPWCFC